MVGIMRNTELCAVCWHADATVDYLCPHDGKDWNLGYVFKGACMPVICILVGKLRKLLVQCPVGTVCWHCSFSNSG